KEVDAGIGIRCGASRRESRQVSQLGFINFRNSFNTENAEGHREYRKSQPRPLGSMLRVALLSVLCVKSFPAARELLPPARETRRTPGSLATRPAPSNPSVRKRVQSDRA